MSLIKQELYFQLIEDQNDEILRQVYEEYAARQAWRDHQAMMEELDEEATYPLY